MLATKVKSLKSQLLTAAVVCVIILFAAAQPVQAQVDASTTVPAPTQMMDPEVWVDMDVTGNSATAVGTVQRCRLIDDGPLFDVDVVAFNTFELGIFTVAVAWDPMYVKPVAVDNNFLITSTGLPLCTDAWFIIGNELWIDVAVGGPGALASGDGVLSRITFTSLSPLGQSGFDITHAGLTSRVWCPFPLTPPECTACDIEMTEPYPVLNFGVAQGFIDPTATIGCWTVTSTGDDGDLDETDAVCDTDPMPGIINCTLRAAIEEANAYSGANRISFRIPDSTVACGPPCEIMPDTPLPELADSTGGTEIDATTQTAIVLNGATVVAGNGPVMVDGAAMMVGDGLVMVEPGNTVMGLTIINFTGNGIAIDSDGNTVKNCYIGLNWTGLIPAPNNQGIMIGPSGSFNTIGGQTTADRNVISGNTNSGILIASVAGSCNSNVIEGNYIGTDATGMGALPNGEGVVLIASFGGTTTGNVIGGLTAASRNVISGNTDDGVAIQFFIAGTDVSGNSVKGNYIGLDAAGLDSIPNGGDGVEIMNSPDNTVGGFLTTGGPGTPPGNVIAGNSGHGVHIIGALATENEVQGNRIGVNTAGNASKINPISLDAMYERYNKGNLNALIK